MTSLVGLEGYFWGTQGTGDIRFYKCPFTEDEFELQVGSHEDIAGSQTVMVAKNTPNKKQTLIPIVSSLYSQGQGPSINTHTVTQTKEVLFITKAHQVKPLTSLITCSLSETSPSMHSLYGPFRPA